MLTVFFFIAMVFIFVKLFILAVKAAWGITKILCAIFFLPLFLISLVAAGLMIVAVPMLAIIGAATLIGGAAA